LKFTPVNFSNFIASENPAITKCLSGFCIVGNDSNLVMHKLILKLKKRTITCTVGVWVNTSTRIREKLKLSSCRIVLLQQYLAMWSRRWNQMVVHETQRFVLV
jgi:hypothetical protein